MQISIKSSSGELNGYTGRMQDVMGDIAVAIDRSSGFNQHRLTEFFMLSEDNFSTVSFLERILVKSECRGKGEGAKLLDEYCQKADKAELRFLLARIESSHKDGFDILDFYRKRGYVALAKSSGDMLMVNEENAEYFFNEFLGRTHVQK